MSYCKTLAKKPSDDKAFADSGSDSDDAITVEDERLTFITWIYDLEVNRLDPVTLFQLPFYETFTPYPFQDPKEVQFLRTSTFEHALKAAFPKQVEEIYLFHAHCSRRNPRWRAVEWFIKILGGYMFFELRQGGCGCKYPSSDHHDVRRMYFGTTYSHIYMLATVSRVKECWVHRAAEHRYSNCFRRLSEVEGSSEDTNRVTI